MKFLIALVLVLTALEAAAQTLSPNMVGGFGGGGGGGGGSGTIGVFDYDGSGDVYDYSGSGDVYRVN